jgi:hypothetical protein
VIHSDRPDHLRPLHAFSHSKTLWKFISVCSCRGERALLGGGRGFLRLRLSLMIGDPGRLLLSQGVSVKPDESEGC